MANALFQAPEMFTSWFLDYRSALFDYVVRMTGDRLRTQDTMSELLTVLKADWASYDDERKLVETCLATARRFNGDFWNQDTRQLVNSALSSIDEEDEAQWLMTLDGLLRKLDGPSREVAILVGRLDLTPESAASIMELSPSQILSLVDRARSVFVEAGCDDIVRSLKSIPDHPEHTPEEHTLALSSLLSGFRESAKESKLVLWLLLLGVVLIVGFLYFIKD